jgi:hypothetical protein
MKKNTIKRITIDTADTYSGASLPDNADAESAMSWDSAGAVGYTAVVWDGAHTCEWCLGHRSFILGQRWINHELLEVIISKKM